MSIHYISNERLTVGQLPEILNEKKLSLSLSLIYLYMYLWRRGYEQTTSNISKITKRLI